MVVPHKHAMSCIHRFSHPRCSLCGENADKKDGQDTAAMLPLDANENGRYKGARVEKIKVEPG